MTEPQDISLALSGTTAAPYLKNVYDACLALGCPQAPLLDLIPGGQHVLNNAARRFDSNILFQMLHHAEAITGCIGIGVLTGKYVRPGTMGDLGHAMVAADTLEDMIKLYRDYQPLLLQVGETGVEKEGKRGRVFWSSDFNEDEYLRPYVERFFGGVVTFGRWVTWDKDLALKSVHFRHSAPDDLSAYEALFDCKLCFNSDRNYVEVPVELLEHEMPQPNPELVSSITLRLDAQLAELDDPITVERETFQIIKSILPQGAPTIVRVASAMGTTERTLRRHLKDAGCTYRDLLESARRDACEVELKRGVTSVAILAQTLGYSEQSAFTRAFKSWYGAPPSQYIKK